MPHDVAVPEYSPDLRDSIGEKNRKTLPVALELRHRALTCGAEQHRHPTRTIPFPLSDRTVLPFTRERIRAPGSPAAPAGVRICFTIDLRQGEVTHVFPEVLECA
jgi:hypothetical protein